MSNYQVTPRRDDLPLAVREKAASESWLVSGILVTVLCGFVAVQLLDILTSRDPSHGIVLALGIASVVMVFGIQLLHSLDLAARWPVHVRVMTLTTQAIVTYLPILVLGKEWGAMAGFLAGSVLLLLPSRYGWPLFGLIIASMIVEPILGGMSVSYVAYLTVATLDTGLVIFGLSRLMDTIRQVRAARGELAQLAVIRERMRFARDLHDLLGYSLSAVTLKAELVKRLVGESPERARDELSELIDVARQALADVRVVSSGYRNMSLSKEAGSVASLLVAAGIETTIEVTCSGLDEGIDTVLATVLREGVTNLLRHSGARLCSIKASQKDELVRLEITNDGVLHPGRLSRSGGGLENLSTRLKAIGGGLTATTTRDGWFSVVAETPVRLPQEDPAAR
ncbi:MAG: sensor histidine kinase [Trebonia sp.]